MTKNCIPGLSTKALNETINRHMGKNAKGGKVFPPEALNLLLETLKVTYEDFYSNYYTTYPDTLQKKLPNKEEYINLYGTPLRANVGFGTEFSTNIWLGLRHKYKFIAWFKKDFLSKMFLNSPEKPKYIFSSNLNKEIKKHKNDLFKIIHKFLVDNKLDNNDLSKIDITKRENYITYKEILTKFKLFYLDKGLTKEYQTKLPNLDKINTPGFIEAYYALTALVNYDNVLNEVFEGSYKGVDKNNENNLDALYMSEFDKQSTFYFTGDEDSSKAAEAFTSKYIKNLVSIIPFVPIKKSGQNGHRIVSYLNSLNLNSLGARLNAALVKNYSWFSKNFSLEENGVTLKFEDLDFINDSTKSMYLILKFINNSAQDTANSGNTGNYIILRDMIGAPNLSVLHSIMEFISFNNIEEKDRFSEFKLIDAFINILENSALSSYTVVSDGKRSVKVMGSYNAQSVYLQNNLDFRIKTHVINKKNTVIFDRSNVEKFLKTDVTDLLLENTFTQFSHIFRKNMSKMFGIVMSDESIELFLSDNSGKTLEELLNELDSFMKNILDADPDEGAETGRKYIAKHLGEPIWNSIENSILNRSNVLPVTTIKSLERKSLPAFKIPTFVYADLAILQKNRENTNNVFIENDILVGTGQRLEVSKEDDVKPAVDLNEKDSFLFDAEHGFFNQLTKDRIIELGLGTLSDKKTLFTKQIKINENIAAFTSEDFRKRMLDIHTKNINSILEVYKQVFIAMNLNMNPFITYESSPTEENLTNLLGSINSYLDALSSQDFTKVMRETFNKTKINIVQELHYVFHDGKVGLPTYIWDSYKIASNDLLFQQYVKQIEENFILKYKHYLGKDLFEFNFLNNTEDRKTILNMFGIKDSEKLSKLVDIKGNLNPLLKKYLWITNILRQDYLNLSTKGDYLDTYKFSNGEYNWMSTDVDWDNYNKITAFKFVTGSKRANQFTATIEKGVTSNRPKTLNMAIIKEPKYYIFNPENSGDFSVLDGATFIDSREYYSTIEAYPGKSYSGVLKRFGVFTDLLSASQKKDSEHVLNNSFILMSGKKGRNLLEKMWSVELPKSKNLEKSILFTPYKIGDLIIESVDIEIKDNLWYIGLNDAEKIRVDTLYDIWEALGGEYSTNLEGDFSEDSQQVFYKISKELNLMSTGIHILTSDAAIKRGVTNLNPVESWEDKENLMYFQIDYVGLGIQQDSNHDVDNDEVREVSQVIAALSQNSFNNSIATSVYKTMHNSIQKAITKFLKDTPDKPFRDKIIDALLKSLNRTKIDDIATNIAELLKTEIPISDNNFFKRFIREMLTIMNDEFIIQKYSGFGAILSPSHGLVKVFETLNTKGETIVKTRKDLSKQILKDRSTATLDQFEEYKKLNENNVDALETISNALKEKFPEKDILSIKKMLSLLLSNKSLQINCV